jgi:superfamily II DNA/RNA helicase
MCCKTISCYAGLLKYQALSRRASTESQPQFSANLFSDLGVSSKLCKSLTAEGITTPTPIQHEALPMTLFPTQHCIIQSPTGSGKTLAFLIPALQDSTPGLNSLIVVPSRELAIQIGHLAKKLISVGRLSRSLLTLYSGGTDTVTNKDVKSTSLPSVIVGTPKRILELVDSKASIFKFVHRVVLDEVDKLLPPDKRKAHSRLAQKKLIFHHEHKKPTSVIMKKLVDGNENVQCIASSATVNEQLIGKLVQSGWKEDYRVVSTSQIESLSIPKTIRHSFIMDSGNATSIQYNKLDILATYLGRNPGKAMVVIHRNAPISTFVFELRQRNVNAVPLHEQTLNAGTYSSFLQEFQSGNSMGWHATLLT